MGVDELVHSILEDHGGVVVHYASPYYDPVKAKEYYERTKQLKGREKAAPLTKNQSQAIGYANKNIVSAKQTESKKLSADREAKMKAASERIKKKLEETIAKRADALFKRLENLPEDVNPDVVARLMKSHSKNANKARSQASKELQSTFTSIRSTFAKARKDLETKYANAKTKEETNIRAQVR